MDSNQTAPPIRNPAPLPIQNSQYPTLGSNNTPSVKSKWPRGVAIVSIVLACTGILPTLVFAFSCIDSHYSGIGLGMFMFFFLGFVIHGIGLIAGLVGLFMGVKVLGFIGSIGNVGILVITILSFLIGVF